MTRRIYFSHHPADAKRINETRACMGLPTAHAVEVSSILEADYVAVGMSDTYFGCDYLHEECRFACEARGQFQWVLPIEIDPKCTVSKCIAGLSPFAASASAGSVAAAILKMMAEPDMPWVNSQKDQEKLEKLKAEKAAAAQAKPALLTCSHCGLSYPSNGHPFMCASCLLYDDATVPPWKKQQQFLPACKKCGKKGVYVSKQGYCNGCSCAACGGPAGYCSCTYASGSNVHAVVPCKICGIPTAPKGLPFCKDCLKKGW